MNLPPMNTAPTVATGSRPAFPAHAEDASIPPGTPFAQMLGDAQAQAITDTSTLDPSESDMPEDTSPVLLTPQGPEATATMNTLEGSPWPPWPPGGLGSLWLTEPPSEMPAIEGTSTASLAAPPALDDGQLMAPDAVSKRPGLPPQHTPALEVGLAREMPAPTLTATPPPADLPPFGHQAGWADNPLLPTMPPAASSTPREANRSPAGLIEGAAATDTMTATSAASESSSAALQETGAGEQVLLPTPMTATAPTPPNLQVPIPAPQHPTAHLPAPDLYADNFADTLGPHIQWLAGHKIGQAHIQLNPQNLGPVEVHLQLDGDQLQANFSSTEAEVRQALEHNLPRLRELLEAHGLQLTRSDVNQQSPQQRSASTPPHTGTSGQPDENAPQAVSLRQPVTTRTLLDAYA